jgi:glycine cleavage system H lipoate-binding protein
MPVDGKLMQVNDKLLSSDQNILLEHAEGMAWLALIVPTLPCKRGGLLLPEECQVKYPNKCVQSKK